MTETAPGISQIVDFLKDAPIPILDEPTEGLDRATEREGLAALAEPMRDRSVLPISHRLETLGLVVDRVAELDGGRIVAVTSPCPDEGRGKPERGAELKNQALGGNPRQ